MRLNIALTFVLGCVVTGAFLLSGSSEKPRQPVLPQIVDPLSKSEYRLQLPRSGQPEKVDEEKVTNRQKGSLPAPIVKTLVDERIHKFSSQSFSCQQPGCQIAVRSAVHKALLALSTFSRLAQTYNGLRGKDLNELWTRVFPVIQCSYLERLCDEPDGCRYVCNHRHLIPPLTVVAVGSNNEWDYEVSLINTYGPKSIASLDVFDCTVDAVKLSPPSTVSALSGFKFHHVCLAGDPAYGAVQFDKSVSVTEFFKPYHGRKIDLLKIDVEGSEFAVIHTILVALRSGKLELPVISQLQMEVHAEGSTREATNDVWWLLSELASLGFLLARQERNPWYAHCMEMLFVHVDFFVESEVGVALMP